MTIDCDVLIIGSGAAGAVLAATLAERTELRIVLVERGGHFGREAMTRRELQMHERLYADGGTRATDDGAIAVRGGACVGGGTTVNVALCLDPVPRVWDGWRRERGLDGFSFDPTASDHGVPGLNMAACLAEVRARLNVHEPSDAEVNENNQLFARGCRASGIGVRKFELNMRGCTGCGFCFAGCDTDAKQGTMVTYVQDAVANGVTLVHHCAIEAIDFEGDGAGRRAVGAHGRIAPTRAGSRPNPVPDGPVRFTARLVIVAAGAIESPALLQRSGHPDPHGTIGRGLILHPSLGIVGVFDHEVVASAGIEGTMYSDHFVAAHGFFLQCLFAPLGAGAATLPGFGPAHFELMRRVRRLATFGACCSTPSGATTASVWDAAAGRTAHLLPAVAVGSEAAGVRRGEGGGGDVRGRGARGAAAVGGAAAGRSTRRGSRARPRLPCVASSASTTGPCWGRRTARARPRWAKIPPRRSSTRAASRTMSAT